MWNWYGFTVLLLNSDRTRKLVGFEAACIERIPELSKILQKTSDTFTRGEGVPYAAFQHVSSFFIAQTAENRTPHNFKLSKFNTSVWKHDGCLRIVKDEDIVIEVSAYFFIHPIPSWIYHFRYPDLSNLDTARQTRTSMSSHKQVSEDNSLVDSRITIKDGAFSNTFPTGFKQCILLGMNA